MLTPHVARKRPWMVAAAAPANCWYRMDLTSMGKQRPLLAHSLRGGPCCMISDASSARRVGRLFQQTVPAAAVCPTATAHLGLRLKPLPELGAVCWKTARSPCGQLLGSVSRYTIECGARAATSCIT
jgi:hypothetical protein